MKLFYVTIVLSFFLPGCKNKESYLTDKTWVLKNFNTTINSKENKDDKETFRKRYKSNFTLNFISDDRVLINTYGEAANEIELNWKWASKEDLTIYREKDFQNLSSIEFPFYGTYLVSKVNRNELILYRIIVPFEEDETFIFSH